MGEEGRCLRVSPPNVHPHLYLHPRHLPSIFHHTSIPYTSHQWCTILLSQLFHNHSLYWHSFSCLSLPTHFHTTYLPSQDASILHSFTLRQQLQTAWQGQSSIELRSSIDSFLIQNKIKCTAYNIWLQQTMSLTKCFRYIVWLFLYIGLTSIPNDSP